MAKLATCLSLVCLFVGSQCGTVHAARYVPIEVTVDGEAILKGHASDNGEPDADEVWETLKRVNLGKTEAFVKLGVAPQAKEFAIKGKARKSVRINVRYGGIAETHTLVLRRMPLDSVGRAWRIPEKGEGPLPHGSADLVGHEAGHGFDTSEDGDPKHKHVKFQEAHESDKARASTKVPPGMVGGVDNYFLSNAEGGTNNAGANSETFAESVALFAVSSTAKWPALVKFWQSGSA